jgi:UDPglucose 6-dehydrogenase
LQARLGTLQGKTIAVLGLVYTPGTDTLRRSAAVELCQQLLAAGAKVQAFDPALKSLASDLGAILLAPDLASAIRDADAGVVCTEWPQFRIAPWAELITGLRSPAVMVDANRFLDAQLKPLTGVEHISVGRPTQ